MTGAPRIDIPASSLERQVAPYIDRANQRSYPDAGSKNSFRNFAGIYARLPAGRGLQHSLYFLPGFECKPAVEKGQISSGKLDKRDEPLFFCFNTHVLEARNIPGVEYR